MELARHLRLTAAAELSEGNGTRQRGDEHRRRHSESSTRRLRTRLNPARTRTKNLIHAHFPRYVLQELSRVGLVWMPEEVLTTVAVRGTDLMLIASPEDAE